MDLSGKHVLISARFDRGHKEKLARELCANLKKMGFKMFMVEVGPGQDFGSQTTIGLHKMWAMIAICFEDYGAKTDSQYCTYYEVQYAYNKRIPILPIQLCKTFPPEPKDFDGQEFGAAQNGLVFPDSLVRIDWSNKAIDAEAVTEALAGEVAKALRILAGGAGPAQGHGAVAAATSQFAMMLAKMSISWQDQQVPQDQQALKHVKQAFRDVKTAADLDRIIPGQEQAGYTPLHMCAYNGDVQLVGHCIAAGCYVDIQNARGVTPLYLAAQYGHVPVVDRLLAAKCNMNKPMNDGATPLYIAAWKGHLGVVERLVAASANVNTPMNNTATPLAVASGGGHVEVVRALWKAGADKTVKTKWGTALEWARKEVKDKAKLAQLEDMLR